MRLSQTSIQILRAMASRCFTCQYIFAQLARNDTDAPVNIELKDMNVERGLPLALLIR